MEKSLGNQVSPLENPSLKGANKIILLFVFCILLASLFFINNAYAQVDSGIDTSGFEEEAGKILNATKTLKNLTEENRWEYIGEQWKALLLKNKGFAVVDKTFRNLNFLFFFLFGENYDLSLTLLFAILLWIFFFAMFGKITSSFSTFSEPVSYVVAFCMAVILAHLKFYHLISLILFKIIFFKSGIWSFIFLVIFFALYLIVLIFIERIIWKIVRLTKKTKEEQEKWDARFKFKVFEKRMEGMEKAFGSVGRAIKNP